VHITAPGDSTIGLLKILSIPAKDANPPPSFPPMP